jgi:hypothetical protein
MAPGLQRIVRLISFADEQRTRPALRYWLSRPPMERVAAVEYLRDKSMDLAPDFDEFIGSLTAHGVEFIVVGAYALAFHGAPRFTGDLDILVRPTLDNATRLLTALEAFGCPVQELTRNVSAQQARGWSSQGSRRHRCARARSGRVVSHARRGEWAYDRESHIGQLVRGLDEGPKRGWVIVDMKNDWKAIYPEQH